MSVFSQTYENRENLMVTIKQATTKKELISLYLANQTLIETYSEPRRAMMKALADFDKLEAEESPKAV